MVAPIIGDDNLSSRAASRERGQRFCNLTFVGLICGEQTFASVCSSL